jgi:tetratricopeptide (TPR) repeat protein
MPTIAEALSIALGHHQACRLQEAEQIYRQILAADPNSADAWQLLGLVAYQVGENAIAVECFGRALELRPDLAEAHNNLGLALRGQRKLNEAVTCYRRAIELQPDFGKAHNNLGDALQEQGRLEEALGSYRRALELDPSYAEAHYNLACALRQQEKLDDAIQSFRRALQMKPDYAEAANNLGAALEERGTAEEAVQSYRQALKLKPDYAEALNNLGNALKDQRKLDESAECFRRAIELNPNYAEPHFNQSLLHLLRGDLQRGWAEYEWRWKTRRLVTRSFDRPEWNGERVEGRTIFIHVEQGLGDTIQFIRYAPLVKSLGAITVVGCQKKLVPLLTRCPGIDRLIGEGDAVPAFDFHVPLLSLPRIFKTTVTNIPANVPYLSADPSLAESWRATLDTTPGFRIGFNWSGRSGSFESRRRNLPLPLFERLAQIPGVRLISLQKGAGQAELAAAGIQFPITDLGDFDTARGAFMDTAAIMKNLDLVISSDTAVPHLAGALGIPVWLALPLVPNWRWLLDRPDTPWYPTMRLFRQKRLGNWTDVFDEMKAALHELTTDN